MRKRYKIVLNVEIDDPEQPYPAGGDYMHLSKIEGIKHSLSWTCSWLRPQVTITVDKVIDKGEVKEKKRMADRLIKIGSRCFCQARNLLEGDVVKLLGEEYTVSRLEFGGNGNNYVRIITTNGPYRYLLRAVDDVSLVKTATD